MQNITPPDNIVDTNIYHPVPFLAFDKPLPLTAPKKDGWFCASKEFLSVFIIL
jgi:hypothetical protein